MENKPTETNVVTIDTLQDIIEMQLYAHHTHRKYIGTARRFLFKGYTFTKAGVLSYLNKLDCTPTTKNSNLAVLKSLAGLLYDSQLLSLTDYIGITRINKMRASNSRGKWLHYDQMLKVIDSTTHDVIGWRDKALISLLFGTGLRRAEVARLRWSFFYFSENKLYIKEVRTKGNMTRGLVVQKFAVSSLLSWGNEVCRQWGVEQVNGIPHTDGYVFVPVRKNEEITRRQLSTTSIGRIVSKCGKKAGYKLRAHDCRKTYAGLLKSGGVDIKTIQLMLGQTTLTATEKYLSPIMEIQNLDDEAIIIDRKNF